MQVERKSLVIFSIHDSRYALALHAVKRVVRVAEITPLPRAPEIVLGVINIAGTIVPVVNLRKRFSLPHSELKLTDHFIVAATPRRDVALVADSVSDVIERATEEIIESGRILPGLKYVEGVVKLPDGIILIHDLETFLSLDEERALDEAMSERTRATHE